MDTEKLKQDILQNEFARIYKDEAEGKKPRVNPETDAVVVLSGRGIYDKKGDPITWVSPENIVRIGFAIDIIRKLVAERVGKKGATLKDIEDSQIKLFLNGEQRPDQEEDDTRDQLRDMRKIAEAYNFPSNNIVDENCLVNGEANTKTQFLVMNTDSQLAHARRIALITSDYHAPRVLRTADKLLREGIEFDVLPAPQHEFQQLDEKYNVFEKVAGELRRIVDYSKKGDLSSYPTRSKLS